jgi:hypothetical protein
MRRGLSLRSPPRTCCRAPEKYATVSITSCSVSASQRRAECPPLPCRQSMALVTASLCFVRFGSTASVADILDISVALAGSKKRATACNNTSRAVTAHSPRSTSCSKTRTTSSEPAARQCWLRLLAQQSSRTERSQNRRARRNDCVKSEDRPQTVQTGPNFFLSQRKLITEGSRRGQNWVTHCGAYRRQASRSKELRIMA